MTVGAMRFLKRRSGQPGPASAGHRPATKLDLLSETDIFQGLDSQEMAEVERMTAMTTCRRGKVFWTAGETGEALFILKRGRVNLYRISPEGRKLVIATIGPGTVFGELALIGQRMHDTFAEAAEDCTLCVMSRTDVEYLITSKPQLALRFVELMADRLREAQARLEVVAFRSVPARVAAALLQLSANTQGEITGVSHQELADMVGTYRETVTRILNEFRNAGHIELERLRCTVRKPEALRAIAESQVAD